MAVSPVAGSAVGASSSTSISKPTTSGYSEQSGDLIIVMCESSHSTGSVGTPTLPTGFTSLGSRSDTFNGAGLQTIWGYKVDSGSETWPKSFTAGANADYNVWSCIIVRGQDSTNSTDGTATTTGITSGSSLSLAAITASVSGDLLVILLNDSNDVDVTTWPSGVTEYANASNATGNGVIVGTESGLASGSTGTLSITVGTGAGPVQACALLVKAPAGTTNVTVTDSGSGSDAVNIAVSFTLSETGTGADAISEGPAPTDSGTGVESLTFSVTLATPDSGTGSDAANIAVALAVVDTGTGADVISGAQGATIADSGTGSETTSQSVALAVPESGVGNDFTILISVPITIADSGTGSESVSVSQGGNIVTVNEAGTGADAVNIAVTLAQADAGIGAEVVVSNGWVTVFFDNFDGSALDATAWNLKDDVGDPDENSVSAENPANVSVSGGAVTLSATNTPYRGMSYSGATIDTYEKFYVRNGALEFRVKTNFNVTGLESATVWLADDNSVPSLWQNEIDALECKGTQTLQNAYDGAFDSHNVTPPADLATNYHVIRVEWTPSGVTWFIDGAQTNSSTKVIPQQLAITADIDLGGAAGTFSSPGSLPLTSSVDYVVVQVPYPFTVQSMAAQPSVGGASIPPINLSTSAPAVPEQGYGGDVVSVTVGSSVADAGAGVEALSTPVTVAVAEAGTGTDTPNVSFAALLSETGSGADSASVPSVLLSLSDAGAGGDAVSVAASVPMADAGTGSDSASVGLSFLVSDAGAGSDAVIVAPMLLPIIDVGTGAESFIVGVIVPVIADAGSGFDFVTGTGGVSFGTVLVSDAGSGSVGLSDAAVATVALSDAID